MQHNESVQEDEGGQDPQTNEAQDSPEVLIWTSTLGPRKVGVDTVLDEIWAQGLQWKLIATLCFANLVSGMQLLWLTFLVPEVGLKYQLTSIEQSAIQGAAFFGSILGAPFFGRIADVRGRRAAYILSLSLITLFGIVSAVSTGPLMLGLCQLLIGFASAGTVAPFVYLSESSPSRIRGKICTTFEMFWGFGSILSVVFCWLFLARPGGWRIIACLCAVTVLSGLIAIIFLPESPRWLLSQGRHDEASLAFRRLAKIGGTQLAAFTLSGGNNTAIEEHEQSPSQLTKRTISNGGIFSRAMRKRTLALILCWSGFMVGYFGCVNVLPLILKSDHSINYFAIAISAASESISAVATVVVIERSRKQCLFFSGGGAAACILALGLLVGKGNHLEPLLTMLAFVGRGLFSAALGTMWVITPESYPTKLRGSAGSCMFSIGRLSAAVSAYLVYSNLSVLKTCGAVALCTLLASVIALAFLRETAGNALTDEDDGVIKHEVLKVVHHRNGSARSLLQAFSRGMLPTEKKGTLVSFQAFDNHPILDIEAQGQTLQTIIDSTSTAAEPALWS